MSSIDKSSGITRPAPAGNVPQLLVSTAIPVVSLFAATFLIGAGLVLWLIRLRVGVFELQSLPIFFSLFVFLDYWPAIVALLVTAGGLLRPVQSASLQLVEAIGNRPKCVASVTFVVLALGARFVYQAHPLSMDEYAPYFQSRVFAAGALVGQFPVALLDWLIPPGFQNVFLNASPDTGQVASAYMPGFALLLTPFTWLGVPWLCNPVLGAASVLVLHSLAIRLFCDARAAGLAVLLAIASAAFTVNSMSFYSMPAHALANGVFALLLLDPTVRRCVAAGMVGSFALVLHNPLPHTLFALPWLIWLMARPDRFRLLPAILAAYMPIFLLLGIGWTIFSLDLQAAASSAAADAGGILQRWFSALTSFLTLPSREVLFVRAIGLAKLWIWSVPVLLCAAAVGAWTARTDCRVRLLALSSLATLLGFLFIVFSQGHGWGFRYFHSAWLSLPLLAVAAVRPASPTAREPPHTTFAYTAAVSLLALLFMLPLQVWQVHGFVVRHLAQVPQTDLGTPRVVIISTAMGYYSADLVQNDPFLRDPVIYMLTAGRSANSAMIENHFGGLQRLSADYRGEVWGTVPTR